MASRIRVYAVILKKRGEVMTCPKCASFLRESNATFCMDCGHQLMPKGWKYKPVGFKKYLMAISVFMGFLLIVIVYLVSSFANDFCLKHPIATILSGLAYVLLMAATADSTIRSEDKEREKVFEEFQTEILKKAEGGK
jgi:vacuolar-type H+-ATPase subunit I/STV1